MTLTTQDIEWRATPPDIPAELPVAIVATPSYEERLHAVGTLHDRFELGETLEVDLLDGVAHASARGEVRYFSASGAVRARRAGVRLDDGREWTDVDQLSETLFVDAGELLRGARLLADGLGDVDVVFDQWTRLNEIGKELGSGPGRAVVRARYSVDGFPLIGAGAKTRLAYEPVGGQPMLTRLLHVHRPVTDVRLARTGGTERAITGLLRDPFLAEHHAAGHRITVTAVEIGLLALPAIVPQRIAAPALAVTGVVDDLRFSRYYQAVSARALRRIGLAAAHLPH
jgi:hypothetical protein